MYTEEKNVHATTVGDDQKRNGMVFACSNFVFVVVAAFRNSGSFRSIRATRDGGRRLLLFRRYMFRFSLFYFYSIFFTHTNMLTILLCVRELADLCAVFDKMEKIAFSSFLVDFFLNLETTGLPVGVEGWKRYDGGGQFLIFPLLGCTLIQCVAVQFE